MEAAALLPGHPPSGAAPPAAGEGCPSAAQARRGRDRRARGRACHAAARAAAGSEACGCREWMKEGSGRRWRRRAACCQHQRQRLRQGAGGTTVGSWLQVWRGRPCLERERRAAGPPNALVHTCTGLSSPGGAASAATGASAGASSDAAAVVASGTADAGSPAAGTRAAAATGAGEGCGTGFGEGWVAAARAADCCALWHTLQKPPVSEDL